MNDKGRIDYKILVNRQHPMPAEWETELQTVKTTNSCGQEVEVEKKTYAAYLAMAKELQEEDRIHIELDSGWRSIAEQQRIWDEFMATYGEDYTRKTAAVPGYSEHHTGLAIDLYFIDQEGTVVYYNKDLVKPEYDRYWAILHQKLPKYGFILRYPKGKEAITGYKYEPWHLRYIDNPALAQEITDNGITLEEYLGEA